MIKTKAYAKFDLAISINPDKMSDGYYPVHYIDCQIDLCDELVFESAGEAIEIICDSPELSDYRDNFVYKTAVLFREIVGRKNLGAKITLSKKIPIRAGFGGGSSDGAATLLGLSRLWEIKLTKDLVKKLSYELGKDFYFSVYGGLGEVIGKGKDYKIVPLKSKLPDFWLLVVVPREHKPSTKWVYDHLKKDNIDQNSKIEKLKSAILKHDRMGILNNLTNGFENSVSLYYPVVGVIEDHLTRFGAQAAIMAGSGLSVVGFFESRSDAKEAKRKFSKMKEIKDTIISKIVD